MKAFWSSLLLLVSTAGWAATPAADLANLLSSYRTFSAHFTQQTQTLKGQVIAQGKGQFWLLRPNRFRWVSSTPDQQIIVGDGQYVWIYNVDLLQVTKQKLSSQAQSPVKILLGDVAILTKNYNVTGVRLSTQKTSYSLTALDKQQAFSKVILIFDNAKLVQMNLTNSLGQISQFNFTQVKLNPTLDSRLFVFKLPAGVDVIDAN